VATIVITGQDLVNDNVWASGVSSSDTVVSSSHGSTGGRAAGYVFDEIALSRRVSDGIAAAGLDLNPALLRHRNGGG
jgi:hypothetical protein